MANTPKRYMTVTADIIEQGFNISAWMSTEVLWASEKAMFPYQYTYMGDRCTWIIHSNTELTGKAVSHIGETADEICKRQFAINQRRVAVNR